GSYAQTMDQAYRLYTLALAREPEIGAMNRMREQNSLPAAARWMLAASYKLAGLTQAADDLSRNLSTEIEASEDWGHIFGSQMRDRAVVLKALVTLGRMDQAEKVADEISRSLVSEHWYSTQSTAYELMAMAHYVGTGQLTSYTFEYAIDGIATKAVVDTPMYRTALSGFPDRGAQVRIDNTAGRRLFVTITGRGVPASGQDTADAAGLAL